ncbi:lantibiotic dehydratase [Kribbella sp.]|uniref:lantibiotic dehydratase n=1 Tax=Kribbella sp. TaxID=1871183 RepID=UPI002D616EA6|nr:lantibiotic dehydratase [Kribbella sp.]HZX04041.1 lantibiotic dehydratase [Kribbella sp.]
MDDAGRTSALLRITAFPAGRPDPTRLNPAPDDTEADTAYLEELTRDPAVREAIAVSSPSLAGTLDAVRAGRTVEPKKLRRAVLATTSYVLRMTTRPTPFGLMAGVAPASFGERTAVRIGRQHRKGVRADAGWLTAVVRRKERELAVVRPLHLVVNNLCRTRGDRLVLSYLPTPEEAHPLREASVRRNPLIDEVRRLARRPVRFDVLAQRLNDRFATATADRVEPLLLELIAQQFLLTELTPPPSAPDPLGHVLARIPEDPELIAIHARQEAYAAAPWGAGPPEAGPPQQVDLAVDAEVVLPEQVRSEVEQAARLLARVMPADVVPAHLRQYHLDFLEQYGEWQLVPVLDLLDPGTGLGAPYGYEAPESTRAEPGAVSDDVREQVLAQLAQEATADGSGEVVLTDAVLDLLQTSGAADLPSELELGAELVADSPAALDAGEYQVVMSSFLHSPRAGALTGRFSYLLDAAPLVTAGAGGALAAQVEFQAAQARSANVTRVPRRLTYVVTAGQFTPDDPTVLGVDDLLVGATHERLYFWSDRLGAEIVPATFHMLDSRHLAPNVVRFLREVAGTRERGCLPWSWGRVGELFPFVPRVRRGRVIFSPARWRPAPELLETAVDDEVWRGRLDAWRKRWRVPTQVYLTFADHRVGLDLEAPLHQRLLRHELGRRPDATLVEPAGGSFGAGWLAGHAHELVVALRSPVPERLRRSPRPPHAVRSPARLRYYPGGEWLYAKLYAPEDRHDQLTTHGLDVLRKALPEDVDRWFFLRYRDPEPHLRIRLHGGGTAVGDVIHDWAMDLCTAGLAQRLVLDTYEPELARYGGPEAMEAAERAFHADSEAVLDELRMRPPGVPLELLLAGGMAGIAEAYAGPGWRDWFLANYPKTEAHAAFQAIRQQALQVVNEGLVDASLAAVRRRSAEAVRAYAEVRPAGAPLGSLLHMHHNRMAGVTPDLEQAAYAVVRGAVQARLDRERRAR